MTGTETAPYPQAVTDGVMKLQRYLCMACAHTHDSPVWYYRDGRDGSRAYACGEKLDSILNRSRRLSTNVAVD